MTYCDSTRCIKGEIEADWNAAVMLVIAEAELVTLLTVLITELTESCAQFRVPAS